MITIVTAISVTFDENTTNGTTLVSDTREGLTLTEINDAIAKTHLGGSVLVGILMLIGFVGNLHVLLIYAFRTKPSNHRIFILCLGVLDMVTCSIGMPFILVDLRYPLMFYATAVCKILRFVNYFTCASSVFLLLVIATDRYRKICVPLGKQMSDTMAKVSCGIAMTVALAISWPAPLLYGFSRVNTGVGNITGVRCWTEERFKKTNYQANFNFLLMFIVFATFIVLCVLYSMIGVQIVKHKTFKSTVTNSKSLPLSTIIPSSKDSVDTSVTPLPSSEDTEEEAEKEAEMYVKKDLNSMTKDSSMKLKFKSNDLVKIPKKIFTIGRKSREIHSRTSDNTSGEKQKKKLSKEDTRTRRITLIIKTFLRRCHLQDCICLIHLSGHFSLTTWPIQSSMDSVTKDLGEKYGLCTGDFFISFGVINSSANG
ncbi:hypothetical protein CHS0354_035631 [Potamilus streckersoni]|uniref:G-protein coupled receptors family 1 profile domain-containing protein n=1 Tax=Potamilus streckersoni TaxID=2493646 RepID=A0AAE0RRR6_9BIVA|nr:hypothetical protein CHS0354_035631 [Potamilus streckersoni]